MAKNGENLTPVIILGGLENTLSMVRSLGSQGVPVIVATVAEFPVYSSRYCTKGFPFVAGVSARDHFRNLLLGEGLEEHKGSVVFLCSDDAIEFAIEFNDELREHYILDVHQPDQQRAMLNKELALQLAKEAGVAIPEFWHVETMEDVRDIVDDIEFPAAIKPHYSHLFQQKFDGLKLFLVEDREELLEKAQLAFDNGIEFMINEYVPGPSTLLSSFYCHYDHDGNSLFEYTKSIIRRMPNFGGASFHKSHWLPETAAQGDRYFRSFGFTGHAVIEFKKDPRNGVLKVMEINARFVAGQPLPTGCGVDIAWMIYCFLTGREVVKVVSYRENVYLWSLRKDFLAFRGLRAKGEITTLEWLKSLMHTRYVFQLFSLTDPVPNVVMSANWFKAHLRRLF
ncbi:MAG: hypothetical protein V2I26_16850 [Halieaceae bacterium]|jgi:predicted ATP-grasp superfamily ATP-dependent carboligase|nr:hypothetical protein [Halieaceae bacterium]